MRKNILTALFVLFSLTVFSQDNGGIMGRISDAEMIDEPLLFAQLTLSDTDRSVQTNFHGNFEFTDITPGPYVLTVDYLGYESISIPVVVESDKITFVEKSLNAKRAIPTSVQISNEVSITASDK